MIVAEIDFTLNDQQVKEALALWLKQELLKQKRIMPGDTVTVDHWQALPQAIHVQGQARR